MRDPMLHSWGRKMRRRHHRDPSYLARHRIAAAEKQQAQASRAESAAYAAKDKAARREREAAMSMEQYRDAFGSVMRLRVYAEPGYYGSGLEICARMRVTETLASGLVGSLGVDFLKKDIAQHLAHQLVPELARLANRP